MKASPFIFRRALKTSFHIGLIPGDGIGHDVIPWGRKVLEEVQCHTPVTFDFVDLDAGYSTFLHSGKSVPDETLKKLKSCDAALFGAAATPTQPPPGYIPPIFELRHKCNLYANVRPMVSAPIDTKPGRNNVDMVVVRENTECIYVRNERLSMEATGKGKLAICERHISEKASSRIARFAFQLARERRNLKAKTPHVTIVHKANILGVTDGLFLECCHEVAKEFPDISYDDQLVDGFMYKMAHKPSQYDVVVAPNTWGNIISNAGAPLVGGLGMVAAMNEGGNLLVAEPVHGTPSHLEGTRKANPIATMRAAILIAQRLAPSIGIEYFFEKAVEQVLLEGHHITPDLGGKETTGDLGASIVERFSALLDLDNEEAESIFRDG
jgi:homoisocitrate dehydrogenase